MNAELRAALAAVAFLTRVPVGVELDGEDVRRAGPYLPVVGAAVGGAAGAVAELLGAEIGLAAAVLITGAVHQDALADTADATGADTRERALEIMRDPRVGAFGVAATVSDLLVKSAALGGLVDRRRAVRAWVAAGALSRAVPVLLGASLPYARSGEGTGRALSRGPGRRAAAAGCVSVACAAAAMRTEGLRLAAVAAGLSAVAGVALHSWLGGVTGDGLGAALELTETALLAVAARR
jgi:adenosylcobinamide-GDP ribazoletransferase